MTEPPEEPIFRPRALFDALARERIACVVVGAYALELRGLPLVTRDLDLTPSLDDDNLQRLAELLHRHGATVRIRPHELGPVALPPDGRLLAKSPILNLHMPGIGDVDIIHRAAENLGYESLRAQATRHPFLGARSPVLVMSEEHWVAAKEAPPVREKDALHLRLYRTWQGA